jgi:hypothetical protein
MLRCARCTMNLEAAASCDSFCFRSRLYIVWGLYLHCVWLFYDCSAPTGRSRVAILAQQSESPPCIQITNNIKQNTINSSSARKTEMELMERNLCERQPRRCQCNRCGRGREQTMSTTPVLEFGTLARSRSGRAGVPSSSTGIVDIVCSRPRPQRLHWHHRNWRSQHYKDQNYCDALVADCMRRGLCYPDRIAPRDRPFRVFVDAVWKIAHFVWGGLFWFLDLCEFRSTMTIPTFAKFWCEVALWKFLPVLGRDLDAGA